MTITPERAKARLQSLGRDPEWFKRFEQHDIGAVDEYQALMKVIVDDGVAKSVPQVVAGDRELAPEARGLLGEKKADPEWRAKYFAGDKATVDEFRQLTEVAAADHGEAA